MDTFFTVNIGQLLNILVIVAGGIGFMYSMRADNAVVKARLGFQDRQLEMMQEELKKVGEILLSLARTDGRMDRLEDRQLAQGKRLDDLYMQVMVQPHQ